MYKAIKNTTKNFTLNTTQVFNLKGGKYAITTDEHAKHLLETYPDKFIEIGDSTWANEVIKNGTLTLGEAYEDPDDEEIEEIPVSPIVVNKVKVPRGKKVV